MNPHRRDMLLPARLIKKANREIGGDAKNYEVFREGV